MTSFAFENFDFEIFSYFWKILNFHALSLVVGWVKFAYVSKGYGYEVRKALQIFLRLQKWFGVYQSDLEFTKLVWSLQIESWHFAN